MVDPLIPESPGLLSSVGNALSLPGYGLRNLLRGNIGGAARNVVDFGGDLIDALLPGDWIPHISAEEDKPEFSELIGGMDEGLGKSVVDFAGNVLTDPLTFVPGAAVVKGLGKGAEAVGAGIKAADKVLPGVAEGAQNLKLGAKSALGWLEPAMPEAKAALEAQQAAKSMVGRAGQTEVQRILQGTTAQERQDAFDIIQNIRQKPTGEFEPLVPIEAGGFMSVPDQLAEFSRRAAATGKSPDEIARLEAIAKEYIPYSGRQWAEGSGELGIFTKQPGVDSEQLSPGLYAQRSFAEAADPAPIQAGGGNQAITKRELRSGQDVADELNFGGMARGTTLERDLASVASKRAEQQANLAGKAALAKSLLGNDFVSLADDGTRGKVSEIIANMKSADPEGARLLESAWNGLEARGPILDLLSKANRVFKPAAVYGIAFPRVGGIMKNILSFPAQLGIAGEGKQALAQLARTPQTVYEAMRQGVGKAFGWQMPADEISQSAALMEQAFTQAGGRAQNAVGFLRQNGRDDLASAIETGVADGFVSREAVEDSIRNSSWGKRVLSSIGLGEKAQAKAFDLADAPAAAFQGAEQYARLGSYLDMLKRGRTPQEASAAVREALYDYGVKTGANRTLRDIIPFAAYQTNAIRQSAEFLANNPWAAVATGEAVRGGGDAQTYPWMEGQTNIPIGTSEKGEAQFLTGIGLPIEALNSIPNISGSLAETGSELRDNLLGSSQPLVKTAYSVLTGTDPRFGSAFGSYSKLPGNIEGGEFGKAYNQLAGTGLIQPLTTPLQQLGQLIDDRTSAGDKALTFLTGTRVVNVDEDRALQQRLQEYLENNPDVARHTSFYQQGDDPETKALIQALNEAKKRIKEKREATAAGQ